MGEAEREREARLRGIERAGSEITEVLAEIVEDVYAFSQRLTEIEDARRDSAIEERLGAVEQDLASRPKPILRTDPRHPEFTGSGEIRAWEDPHPYVFPQPITRMRVVTTERERDQLRDHLRAADAQIAALEAEREAEAEKTLTLMRERDRATRVARAGEEKLQKALDNPGTDDRINLIEETRSMLAGYLLDIGEG